MKDNIWKKEFTAGDYKIKNLSLANNMELSLINEEIRRFWKIKDDLTYLDIELVRAEGKDGKLAELLERTETLLDEILVDEELKESLEPYQVFILVPDLWYAVKLYKESLKKK